MAPAPFASLRTLIENNKRKQELKEGVTPFIGPGLSSAVFPELEASKIAESLCHQYAIPRWVPRELFSTSEYITAFRRDLGQASKYTLAELTERISREREGRKQRGWNALRQLAEMPFPLYITTNCDDLMEDSLRESGREPIPLVFNWFGGREARNLVPDAVTEDLFNCIEDRKKAVVYHLFGHIMSPDSLVLLEKDYIEFLIQYICPAQRKGGMIPAYVDLALKRHTLLFLGYNPQDLRFRLLMQAIARTQVNVEENKRLLVQFQPPEAETDLEKQPGEQTAYLAKSFEERFGATVISADVIDFIDHLYAEGTRDVYK